MAIWRRAPKRLDQVWRAYRHTSEAYLPLWYGGGALSLRQESGRWHEEGRDVAQYLALSSNGAWAERCRYAHIRDDARRLEERRQLWELQVIEHDVADLSSFERYLDCGLPPELAVGSHEQSWDLAYELRSAGYRGVLSPSAAYDQPGETNLTLFGERIEDQIYGAMPDPSENPRPEMYLVALLVTDAGAPPQYAMHHTCYQNEYHHTFDAWCRTRGYRPTLR
ncbi:MAG: RES family NAD+ phosphorylase [Solirubrobacterales bacterium]|nr:RES family NAD+ phosphorylase [Solirubrobacterales bacterium]